MIASLGARARESLLGWALVLPSLLVFGVFFLIPVGHALLLSFYTWDMASDPSWVGVEHYGALWGDATFREVLINTFIYSSATVALTMGVGLALAVSLNRRGAVYTFIQGCVFTSYIVSWVGVSLLWLWMLDKDYGVINGLLAHFGAPKVDWLGDPGVALWTLVAVTVWKTVGYDMIIFLAGLQAIPGDLYEAAAIDGAGPWQRFWHITVPQLAPTTLFLLITSVIMTFQGFDVVRIMTQGGPVHATNIYVFYVYEQAFVAFRLGYASAAIVIFFVLLMAITLAQFWFFSAGRQGADT